MAPAGQTQGWPHLAHRKEPTRPCPQNSGTLGGLRSWPAGRLGHGCGRDVVGQNLFAVLPDNPNNSAADGVATVPSLLKVLKTRAPDPMPVIRYDVKGGRGPYQERWWQITDTPILGEDGYLRWIINRADDVAELVELRDKVSGNTKLLR